MSWLFGYFGNQATSNIQSPEPPLFSFKSSNLILHAGGNKQTTFFKSNSLGSCWAIVGVGLRILDDECVVLNENDYNSILNSPQIVFNPINGHYVAVKYSDNELEFFTDDLGLREINIVKTVHGYGFTTRIDWLKYFIKSEIELKEFGSRWLLQNQISRKSIIKGVHRLVSSNAMIQNGELKVEQHTWQPDFDVELSKVKFDDILKSLLMIKEKKVSLSLSGGLDSRLLLSYLFNKNSGHWETHTFGDPNHPDSKIASEMLSSLGRKNEIIDGELPSTDKLIEILKNYSIQTMVTNPVSSILNLRFYSRLTDGNRIIIDGGFGEIWRRAFANRLLILGKNTLLRKDLKAIANLLRYNRANIFSEEALIEFNLGISEQLDDLFDEFPDINQIRPEHWIDLLSIRTRLANYYAPEQTRVDQYVISFMPFVQKDILKLLFDADEKVKLNDKFFKQFIKQNVSVLTKYPLVKGKITHSFNVSSLSSRLQSRIKNKLGIFYKDKHQINFLNSMREFIGDIINSSDVRSYEYYDSKKLNTIANKFLSSGGKYNKELDWFLSFELFRQGLSG